LRRCFFHYIQFPEAATMQQIVDVHFPGLKDELLSAAMKVFFDIRKLPGLKKKPSTSELIDWLRLLMAEDIAASVLQTAGQQLAVPPMVGALLKNEQDLALFEKLVFMNNRNR
jgi:MoxR-like ATPase